MISPRLSGYVFAPRLYMGNSLIWSELFLRIANCRMGKKGPFAQPTQKTYEQKIEDSPMA
jgi:hypothetical protein